MDVLNEMYRRSGIDRRTISNWKKNVNEIKVYKLKRSSCKLNKQRRKNVCPLKGFKRVQPN